MRSIETTAVAALNDSRLDEIVDKVVSLAQPNKICLVGALSTALSRTICNANPSDIFETISHYNLLVISSKSNTKHEFQDIIENNCRLITPVTVLVLSPITFNSLSFNCDFFSNSIYTRAKLLYEMGNCVPMEFNQNIPMKDLSLHRDLAYNAARGFLASAELHHLRNEYKLCAFMLHQAIEQFCLANILTHLGINPKIHNLDKLYRLFRFFSFDLVRAFPRDNEREEKLFQAIKDSYTEARYGFGDSMKSKDLSIVILRIKHLLT
jgi:uncharacterized protein